MCELAEVSCHTQENTKAAGNRHPRATEGANTESCGEVGGDAGMGAELGTVGDEMGRVGERRFKAVKKLISGFMSE